MSYIRKIVNQQEKLLLLAHSHWIYLIEALFWLTALIFGGIYLDALLLKFLGGGFTLFGYEIRIAFTVFFTLTGLGIFLSLCLEFVSIEIGLTDRRIVYKKGLFSVEVEEIELGDVRGEVVNHGFFGWMLGYGRIHLDCRYVGDVELPAIRKPYRFLQIMHQAKLDNESHAADNGRSVNPAYLNP